MTAMYDAIVVGARCAGSPTYQSRRVAPAKKIRP
jgi:hypothetical protein